MKLRISIISLLMFIGINLNAADDIFSAQAIYIYNFLRLINWPASSNSNQFVIGVYGNSATYEQLLSYTKNRKIGTKTIIVNKITTLDETKHCQLLYIPASKSSKISEIINYIGNQPCLIVSEKSGTISSGSTIEFVLENDKLKFHIDEANAKKQQLVISKALLDMSA